jgi:hypothetical protein
VAALHQKYASETGENRNFQTLNDEEKHAILNEDKFFVGGLHTVAGGCRCWDKGPFLGLYNFNAHAFCSDEFLSVCNP